MAFQEKLIQELESEKTACNSKLDDAAKAAKEEELEAAEEQPEEEAPAKAAVSGEDQDAAQAAEGVRLLPRPLDDAPNCSLPPAAAAAAAAASGFASPSLLLSSVQPETSLVSSGAPSSFPFTGFPVSLILLLADSAAPPFPCLLASPRIHQASPHLSEANPDSTTIQGKEKEELVSRRASSSPLSSHDPPSDPSEKLQTRDSAILGPQYPPLALFASLLNTSPQALQQAPVCDPPAQFEDTKLDAGADSTEDDALTTALKESKWNADCPRSPRTSEDAAPCDPQMSDNADFQNSRVSSAPTVGTLPKGILSSSPPRPPPSRPTNVPHDALVPAAPHQGPLLPQ